MAELVKEGGHLLYLMSLGAAAHGFPLRSSSREDNLEAIRKP